MLILDRACGTLITTLGSKPLKMNENRTRMDRIQELRWFCGLRATGWLSRYIKYGKFRVGFWVHVLSFVSI
uniref:Histone-lysine N-methyltransferase setd3 n=1 Tax=Rhizophora mucronata TaxID=61149 RepID=A0A2P2KQF2_RHIMU